VGETFAPPPGALFPQPAPFRVWSVERRVWSSGLGWALRSSGSRETDSGFREQVGVDGEGMIGWGSWGRKVNPTCWG